MTEYFAPTFVYFGKDSQKEVGKALATRGYKKVLLHYGMGSVVKSGLLDEIKASLLQSDVKFVELGGVKPNPRLSLVRKGIEIAKNKNVDMIFSVGGGSALDSAKAIAYGACYKGDVWDFYGRRKRPEKALAIGCVLTLSATGSEMSNSSVITNDEVLPNEKVGCNNNLSRPILAFLNPELTYTVSAYQTASGSVDIIMHTLERFFHKGNAFEITDNSCANVIKTVIKYTKIALDNPYDYDARANLMWAGSISHNGFNNVGYDSFGDWACHRMEHELSAFYDVSHGAGLSAIWCSWARYVAKTDYKRFALLGSLVFDIKNDDELAACNMTIELFERVFQEMNMPINLKELGLSLNDTDLKNLAKAASRDGTVKLGNFKILEQEDMYNIYRAANK